MIHFHSHKMAEIRKNTAVTLAGKKINTYLCNPKMNEGLAQLV